MELDEHAKVSDADAQMPNAVSVKERMGSLLAKNKINSKACASVSLIDVVHPGKVAPSRSRVLNSVICKKRHRNYIMLML